MIIANGNIVLDFYSITYMNNSIMFAFSLSSVNPASFLCSGAIAVQERRRLPALQNSHSLEAFPGMVGDAVCSLSGQ